MTSVRSAPSLIMSGSVPLPCHALQELDGNPLARILCITDGTTRKFLINGSWRGSRLRLKCKTEGLAQETSSSWCPKATRALAFQH
jgi:hypothetical protein